MDPRILLRRRIWQTAFVVVVAVGFLLTCASCAKSRPNQATMLGSDASPEDSTSWSYRAHDMHGFMVWSCGRPAPSGFLNLAVLASQEAFEAVVAHEGAHVRLAKSFPDCGAWKAWSSVPSNNLFSEAIAFCAQLRTHVRFGQHPDSMLVALGKDLASYPFGISPREAQVKIRAVCP